MIQSTLTSEATSRKMGLDGHLARIIWVAARPPIPPFSGVTSKTLCGLDALSSTARIDLVVFVDDAEISGVADSLKSFWHERKIAAHFLRSRQAGHPVTSAVQRRFQISNLYDPLLLQRKLNELDWSSPDSLVILDDIVLAHLAEAYGSNAILSPHDCMSQMFYSHYRVERSPQNKLKKYIQYRIARHSEQTYYQYALLVHVIAQRDRIWLERINPRARYHVVPNGDMLNPGLVQDFDSPWDMLIWVDLRIPACVEGTTSFLRECSRNSRLSNARKILVGRVPEGHAAREIGHDLLSTVVYSPFLEDEEGSLRSGKVMVVPDVGGAGLKNRVVNVLSSGLCLACLLPQMEGVEKISDRGAINAITMAELVTRIEVVLENRIYKDIALCGQSLYRQHYDLESNRLQWKEMIERAIRIRDLSQTVIADLDAGAPGEAE